MRRREFIKGAALTSAGLFLGSCDRFCVAPRKFGPNDKINVAQIGFGRIAHYDLENTMIHDTCRIVAIADVDINRAKDGKNWVDVYDLPRISSCSDNQLSTLHSSFKLRLPSLPPKRCKAILRAWYSLLNEMSARPALRDIAAQDMQSRGVKA